MSDIRPPIAPPGTAKSAQILAIGVFPDGLSLLRSHLRSSSIDLVHAADPASLLAGAALPNPLPQVLLLDLTWYLAQSDALQTQISGLIKRCAGCIGLSHPHIPFVKQIELLRRGIGQFLEAPLSPERVTALVKEYTLDGKQDPYRVILIDDQEAVLSLYTGLLEEAGMRVLATPDPLVVLEFMDEFVPDVMVVDIEMASCRGPELVTLIRQHSRYAHIPVIYLTGWDDQAHRMDARRTAAEDFFTKSGDSKLLLQALTAQAQRYRRMSRLEQDRLSERGDRRKRLQNLRKAVDEHAIVSVADVSGNIIEVNDKFCATSGYNREELLGQNHRLLKSSRHSPAFYEDMWSTIASGRVWQGEVCNRSKKGYEYWVRSTIMPFLNEDGLPEQYISIRTDITSIKATEKYLAEREILYRSLVNAVADGMVLHQGDGRVVECNPAAERILGISRAQILGRDTMDPRWHTVYPDGSPFPGEAHPALVALRTGQSQHDIAMGVQRPDGRLVWLNIGANPIIDSDGRISSVVVSFTDVTQRRLDEQQIRDSLNQLEATIRAIPDLLFEMDIDGRYYSQHHSDAALLAVHPDDLLGRQVSDVLPAEAATTVLAAIQEAAVNGRSYGHQIWLEVPKGWRCFELSVARKEGLGAAGKLHFIVLSRDITERKQAEERLQLFLRLIETTEQAIRVSDADDRIQYVNPAYERLLGYSSQEAIGKDFTIGLAAHQEALADEVRHFVRSGSTWRGLVRLKHRDGHEFIAQSNINSIFEAESGRLLYSFSMFVDYSQEVARQEALERAVAAANTANQAKSEFLSRMSHELRTPMNAIIGFSQLMETDAELNDDNRDNVHEILKASRHLLGLINEVLDLAKVEAGRVELSIEAVACGELLEECCSLLRPMANDLGINLVLQALPDDVVRADRIRLKQVFLNLISNAIKYNRNGGSVTLWGEPSKAAGGPALLLHVVDTGIGIPLAKQAELFQPFNRLGAETGEIEGSGIGLVITRNLVELMGGQMGLNSEAGQGSDFWLQLPADHLQEDGDADTVRASDHPAGTLGDATGRELRTVLYIEDNPANLKLVSQIFSRLPHLRLVTAPSPNLGLALAKSQQPDLILLDINLPGMDGYQVLATLRGQRLTADIPVIAVTANAMPGDIARGLTAGFREYLTKPLDIPKFVNVLEHFLAP